MSDTFDIERVKRNCEHFSKQAKAVEVLKKANGKTGYREIAASLNIHHTAVSRYLNEAERLGLVVQKGKNYKKVAGIMKFCKVRKEKNTIVKIADVEKVSKKIHNINKVTPNISIKGVSGVEKMARAYCYLYITENTLRNLIRQVFKTEINWWENKVNPNIKSDVKKLKDNYPYHAASRKDELEYTHLGWLKEIIIAKRNWPLFLPLLNEKDKNSFDVVVNRAIASRNSIAHCTTLTDEDYKSIEVRFKDILKMINS